MKVLYLFLVLLALGVSNHVLANPKKYMPDEVNFQPSNIRYYETNLQNSRVNASSKIDKETKESDRLRFGIPVSNYGHSGSGVQGYPTGVGYGAPTKIDIGGVALGVILGFGAVVLIPKLAYIFSGGYGYRSLEDEMSSVTDILARIDNSLEKNNIDSSSCMQRVICSYVYESQKNMEKGEAQTLDQIIYTITNNPLFSYMLDGSAIKQAVDMGKTGNLEKCASLYMKCPVSKENITQIITNLLPS